MAFSILASGQFVRLGREIRLHSIATELGADVLDFPYYGRLDISDALVSSMDAYLSSCAFQQEDVVRCQRLEVAHVAGQVL